MTDASEFYMVRNVDEAKCKTCGEIHEFWTRNCVPVLIHESKGFDNQVRPETIGEPVNLVVGDGLE